MSARPLACLLVGLATLGAASCGPRVDLSQALTVTDIFSGYYDNGVIESGPQQGWNHLVPQITFRLKNVHAEPVSGVQLVVSYWPAGSDGPKDEREIAGIRGDALAPGAQTDPFTVRSTVGFNLQAPRSELFNSSLYVDWTARVIAKRGGQFYRLGEFPIERRIIPRGSAPGRP
jgi:hypothetical protein